ncbi:hypothetical protein M514_06575 [Trichuris suis]|uniref:Uncharacterized protein n=1 Tax=Trichuris suis TaxID=68888 RepID=A0A085N6V5_9BILA|nr:hypothetical protein M513_06575 [Trichuris suis]KFD65201.1 hypothetical protein M514_06575 [Trichuris suis]
MNASWFHADQSLLLPLCKGQQFLHHPPNNVVLSPFSIDHLLGTCSAMANRESPWSVTTTLPKLSNVPFGPYESWIFGSNPAPTAVSLPYVAVQQSCQTQTNVAHFKETNRKRQVYNKLQVEHLEAAFQVGNVFAIVAF